MAGNVMEKPIEYIQNLKPYLPEKTQEELDEILAYGEKMKLEGERKKQEFWKNHDRNDFKKLLRYKRENKNRIEGQYKYLDTIEGLERERFIEEYLHDDMLYSYTGDLKNIETKSIEYWYEDWKVGKNVMKEGAELYFNGSHIGSEGVKAIAEMKLQEGVQLDLSANGIGDEGAKLISKMELKEGVVLRLSANQIGAEGAEAVSRMELKEGVKLDLSGNEIGAEGAKAISKMELKKGVCLDLRNCGIGDEGVVAISQIKLKECVNLDLEGNKIGDGGAKTIAENVKLKNRVKLDLQQNEIGDEGAETIMDKMELKDGVKLDLRYNNISDNMKMKLREWRKSYYDQGIKCIVKV